MKLTGSSVALLLASGAGAGLWLGTHLAPPSQDGVLDPAATRRPVARRGDLDPRELATIEMFKNTSPSVVFVTRLATSFNTWTMNPVEVPEGSGTGFVWNEKGYVVTNYHVVGDDRRSPEWRVALGDRAWEARVVGRAPEKDLAVLKLVETPDNPLPKLTPIPLGTSKDLEVGQTVYAIGNPFGLDRSLTTGAISALHREIRSPAGRLIRDVIQTDAAINPGNSGGPLLDSAGRLIGVNTAIVSPSGSSAGIGFAIPVDTVNEIVPQLMRDGFVTKPGLGIVPANDSIARRFGFEAGVLVAEVPEDSSAAKAGLKSAVLDRRYRLVHYDVILAIDGKATPDTDSLFRVLEDRRPGERVKVTVNRNGAKENVELTLQEIRG